MFRILKLRLNTAFQGSEEVQDRTLDIEVTTVEELFLRDGKPSQQPSPLAANQGTTITVEDLFYNVTQVGHRTQLCRS